MTGKTWLMLVVACLVLLPAAAPAQNILLNPGFEIDPVEDGIAPAWAEFRSGDGIDTWLKPWGGPDSDWVGVTGHWLPGQWALWGQSVPVTPGQSLTFGVYSAGYPDFTGSTKVKLEFYYPNQEGGEMALAVEESLPINGGHIWQVQEIMTTVPAQAVRVRAMAWVDGAASAPAQGSAKFDDAYLTTSNIPPQVGPGEVKGLADGTSVWLKWPVVVKDNGSDTSHTDVYVTGYGREGTIRVLSAAPIYSNNTAVAVTLGSMLHVVGTVATVSGEKVVQATDIVVTNWDGPWPKPLVSSTRSITRAPDPSGLVMTVVGKVTAVAPDETWFYLDDGAGVAGEGGNVGIKVYHDPSLGDYPFPDDVVSVTGVVFEEEGADTNDYQTITTRSSTDLTVEAIGGTGPGRNLLLNPGFEAGAESWTTPSSSVKPEGWAARTGIRGMAFYTWDEYTEAALSQKVPNAVPGTTYEFRAWLKEEVNHIGTVVMRIEWLDADDNVIGSPDQQAVDPPIDWGEFSIMGVAPAGTASVNFAVLDTEHSPNEDNPNLQAVMVDDTSAKIIALP